MSNLMRWVCALTFATVTPIGAAQAAGTFEVGPQIGYSDYEESGEKISGTAVGLVARYSAPINSSGLFWGLHMGVMKEQADITRSGSGLPVREVFTEWSIDAMPRIGYSFGDVSVSLAAGLSYIKVGVDVFIDGNKGNPLAGRGDSNWHQGRKIAMGIDYRLSEDFSLFGQIDYADYNDEAYFTRASRDLEMVGVHIGVLASF